jgi:RNA polymerase sigma factor (sigma-70 family)
MAHRTLGPFLHLLQVARPPEGGPPSDGHLLERFAAHRDEAAFDVLLRRHGPMVWGVCRRLLFDANDVDDAFQATFLVLVRKAQRIARRESLGSWLHGVARRVALRARLQANQRRERERQGALAGPREESAPDPLWAEVRRVLDEELARLPEKYRAPLILCYLEGKTNDEAAEQLGCTRGTIAGRLNRARALLRGRLTRRGIAIAIGGLGSAFPTQAAPAPVPALLARTTLQTALSYSGGPVQAGTLSPAIALAEGVLTTMRVAKLRMTIAVVMILAVLGTGAGFALCEAFAAPPGSGTGPASPAAPAPVAVPAAAPAPAVMAPNRIHRPIVLWTGPNSAVAKQTYARITEREEWEKIWKRHVGEKGVDGKEVLPEVNFDAYMVVAVFDGDTFNSRGFDAFSITEDKEQVVVRLQSRSFSTVGPDGGAIAVRPYGFFLLPRSTKRLVFERDVRTMRNQAPKWKEVARVEKLEAKRAPATKRGPKN